MTYQLRDKVNEAFDTNPGLPVADVAEKIVADIPPRAIRDVLALLMPLYVEEVMRGRRANNPLLRHRAPDDPERVAARQQSANSRKVAGIRDHFARWLADTVRVDGVEKMLGDCGVADLMKVAEHRRTQAAELSAKADRYEHIANVVRQAKVKRVRDLPKATLEKLINEE